MKVKIEQIKAIDDVPAKTVDGKKYPAQKKIVFIADDGRKIYGWVGLDKFKAEEWIDGNLTPDIEIFQKGEYWNFKFATKNDELMKGLRETYKLCQDTNKLCQEILTRVEKIEKKLETKDASLAKTGEF